jgi:predicted permease
MLKCPVYTFNLDMYSSLIQMGLLMACGVGWRVLMPAGLNAETTRTVLTSVVFYIFLPAMVLEVLWAADIGLQSLQYSLLGMACILVALVCAWLFGKLLRFKNKPLGAIMLAAAFPNVTYLGLPVLEQTFGSWARSVVIQIDLFATAPLVYTLGIMLAQHYGESNEAKPRSVLGLLTAFNSPPFWAAAIAVALNQNQITPPSWMLDLLQKLSVSVAPLMLFSLGLALDWKALRLKNIPYVIPVILIKMGLMPVTAIFLATFLSLDNDHKAAAILDLAMPSMVLGIVLCDRYRLDSSVYAMTVTVTTALSLVTLPFWHGIVVGK